MGEIVSFHQFIIDREMRILRKAAYDVLNEIEFKDPRVVGHTFMVEILGDDGSRCMAAKDIHAATKNYEVNY